MQIVFDGQSYPLKVTFGAMKKMDELLKVDPGVGLVTRYLEMTEGGDPVAMRDLIFCLNSGLAPSLSIGDVEKFLEESDYEEIEKLAGELKDFLLKTGLSRMRIEKITAKINEAGRKPTKK